jgi:hypothetical protein
LDASNVLPEGDAVDFEITHGSGFIEVPEYKPNIVDILMDYLNKTFPHLGVSSTDYTSSPAQPGDYHSPYITVGSRIVGYLQKNYTVFVPFSAPNAREQYKEIKIADPNFFDIFHKMAVYEVGYDPLIPGSREAFMDTSICEYERFHEDIFKIYYPLHKCECIHK